MKAFEWWNSSNVQQSQKTFDGLFKEIENVPKCDFCGKQIQDGFCYRIDGEVVCKHCLERHYREEVIPYE